MASDSNSGLPPVRLVTDNPAPRREKTRDRVQQAAMAMLLAGELPSWRSVRERIGQGSSTTIIDELKVFWIQVGERLRLPDIPEPVAQAALTFWEVAAAEGGVAYEKFQEDAKVAVHVAEAAAKAAEHHADTLKGELTAVRAELRDAQAATAATEQQALTLTRKLDAEIAHRQSTEALLSETRKTLDDRAREHAASLEALSQAQQRELDTLKAGHAEALALAQSRAESTEERYVQRLEALRAEHKGLEAELATARETLAAAQATTAEVRGQAEVLAGAKEQLETTVTALTDELRWDQQAVSRLEERVAGVTETLEATAAERDVLKGQLAAAEATTREQGEALSAHRSELALLKERKPKRGRG